MRLNYETKRPFQTETAGTEMQEGEKKRETDFGRKDSPTWSRDVEREHVVSTRFQL